MNSANKIFAEISVGELLDKISILEIKQKNLKDSEKIKILRRLNDYLANAGDSVMVDYDLETCMIEKVGLDEGELGGSHLGSVDVLQKFNKLYNQSVAEIKDKGGNNDLGALDAGALKQFDTYFREANELPLHEGMYRRLFPRPITDDI